MIYWVIREGLLAERGLYWTGQDWHDCQKQAHKYFGAPSYSLPAGQSWRSVKVERSDPLYDEPVPPKPRFIGRWSVDGIRNAALDEAAELCQKLANESRLPSGDFTITGLLREQCALAILDLKVGK